MRAKSFLKTDAFCALVLALLAPLAYLPAAVLRLSLNPIFFASALWTEAHRGVTLGGPWLDPNTSFTVQALGGLSAQYWLHGHVPWWNPYTGVGLPLAAEMQTISFFLPFVLFMHFANGIIYLKIALQILAGLGTYALIRQLGLGRLAALAGGAIYEFNGPLAWFAHAPIMPIPFLPFLLLGIERAFTRAEQKRRGGFVLIGIALAYSIYAGFPEVAFLNGLLALAWAVYRFVVTRRGARLRFAAKVAIGGVAGILLAAPIVLPFLEYLRNSGLGRVFPIEGLTRISLAPLLMPYILGPIAAFNDGDPTNRLSDFWGGNGGYLGVTVLFLAVLALFTGRRERGLRILLAVWMAVFLAKITNVLHVSYLFSLIPPLNVIAVNRYCEASWVMAGAVLAAYAIDDWRQSEARRIAPVLVSGAITLVLALTGIWLASGVIHSLLQNLHGKRYPLWLWGSIAWALVFTIALAILYSRRLSARAVYAMAALVVANSFCLYVMPTLSGLRRTRLDSGLITFLQKHMVLERFYTLGPFNPNYGAYFQTASINHNSAPLPAEWTNYIRSSLDPDIDSALFIGYFPGPFENREKALRTNLANFEGTGVKYVLTFPGTNPFFQVLDVPANGGPNKPLLFPNGATISGVLPKEASRTGVIHDLSVVIGTYGGPAVGRLKAELCDGVICASAIRSLKKAQDRESFKFPLETPLHVSEGDILRFTFTHIDTHEAKSNENFFFLWLSSPKNATALDDQVSATPAITLSYRLNEVDAKLVYRGHVADIFQLPNPAPYFETRGNTCELSAETRESVRVGCSAPATLVRRELFYPGWRAFVNGHESAVTQSAPIFQAVELPKGQSRVQFSYVPSRMNWALAAATIGFLCLLAGATLSLAPRAGRSHALTPEQGT